MSYNVCKIIRQNQQMIVLLLINVILQWFFCCIYGAFNDELIFALPQPSNFNELNNCQQVFTCLCIHMTSVVSLNRLLQKDSNTESLRYHWLTFRMMRSMLTGRSDWELKMFKGGMFWQISGYVEFQWFHLLPTLSMLWFLWKISHFCYVRTL